MAFALKEVRDSIFTETQTLLAQTVYRGGIPSTENLVYVNGVLRPYVVINFGDMAPSNSRSFIGSRGDGYFTSVNFFAVASTAEIAEDIQSVIIDKMLGFTPTNAGQLNKTPAGGTFTLLSDSGAVEAYTALASFRVNLTAIDV